jgi:high-affinity nickel-transport protein
MTILPALSLGFVLGMTHAADADHVAAMSTLVSDRHPLREAARTGTLWGLGHTLTILLVGGALVATRATMPEQVAASLELLVAAMLVGLGATALVRRGRRGGDEARAHALRPVGVGLVHGLAGSAAVALAVLSEIQQPWLGLAYLVVFGLGTTAGMATVTMLVAFPLRWASARVRSVAAWLPTVAGLVSIAAGVWLAHRVVVVEAAFAAAR